MNKEATELCVDLDKNLKLEHVVGQQHAVQELRSVLLQIKHSDYFSTWGLEKPKALALTGPPGCGKTHSVRAFANELDCALVPLSYEDIASTAFDGSTVLLHQFKDGVESLMEDYGHVVIFIDEADSFFQSRFNLNSHPSDKKRLNFFLRWIDGDLGNTKKDFTFIITTNAWDEMDPALRRPGRFKKIEYGLLSKDDVVNVFKVHMDLLNLRAKRKVLDPNLLDRLPGFPDELTGADIKHLLDACVLECAKKYLDSNEPGSVDFETFKSVIFMFLNEKKKLNRTVGFNK